MRGKVADAGIRVPVRPDLYVVARFLDRLAQPGAGYTRSRLQAAVRLNYDLFRSYLRWLEEKGFVRTVKDYERELIVATPAGLEAHERLVQWIKRVLGERLP